LVEVLDFEDAIDYVNKHKNEQLVYERTTDNMYVGVGYIHGEYIKA
jgi:hypothetical protein